MKYAQIIGDWDSYDLYCSNCNKKLKEIDVQCPHCGARFVTENEICEMVIKLITTIGRCTFYHGRQKTLEHKTDKENRRNV